MKKIFGFLFFLSVITLNAQPSFVEADLPAIGYKAQMVSDTADSIIYDLGNPGGPRTWDFSREVYGDTTFFDVLDPDSTDWDTLFPKAEFVYHTSWILSDTTSGELWEYLRPTLTQVRLLGGAGAFDTIKPIGKCNPEQTFIPLPLEMGSKWSDSVSLTATLSTDPAPVILEVKRYQSSEADAWGTIKVPLGSYEALRVKVYDTIYITITLAGIPFMGDTSMTINYNWVAKDVGQVMSLGSFDGETDPEFKEAGSYTVLVKNNIHVAVGETKLPSSSTLSVIGKKILFESYSSGPVEITVYDILGRSIATLYRGTTKAEKGFVTMPGDLSKGVYFIKMRSGRENLTTKTVVLD